jgi:Rrf2 family protein
MKRLSRRCKYALRALYRLSREHGAPPQAVVEIANKEKIPRKFLEAILVQLRNSGIVESHAGKKGGYRLAKSPDTITIGAIVRVIDGPLAPLACASESAFRTCEECADKELCETRVIMKRVRDAMAGVLDNTTLAEACRMTNEDNSVSYDI